MTKRLADGTSRFVLEDSREGGGQAIALVAAAGSDRKNVEICRLARELGYGPILGIIIDSTKAADYVAVGRARSCAPTSWVRRSSTLFATTGS